MKLKNNRFAAAFDELRRNHGIKTQKELARLMGVSQDTITRILRDYTEVTEDIITKLQTATGCIFNLQYLRGEDNVPMLAADVECPEVPTQGVSQIDSSSMVNALIAAHAEAVESLKRELAAKNTLIEVLQSRISELERKIGQLSMSDIRDYPFAIGAAEPQNQKEYGRKPGK